jgi:hypothetical protein
LKTLTSSFKTLYTGMPEAQKKNADQVFENFGHAATASHGWSWHNVACLPWKDSAMTSIMGARSNRRLPAKPVAGLAFLLLGTLVVTAGAEERDDAHRGGERHDNRGHGGGYYAAPPVVYANPGYYPPPVVYGPAVGIAPPGLRIGIQ